jgi:hypothetical protein
MRLEGIQAGDIVEVDGLGRRLHALVTSNASGGLSIPVLFLPFELGAGSRAGGAVALGR